MCASMSRGTIEAVIKARSELAKEVEKGISTGQAIEFVSWVHMSNYLANKLTKAERELVKV